MKTIKFNSNLILNAKRILSSVLLFIVYYTSFFGQYDTLTLINYLPDFYVYTANGTNWTEIDEICTYDINGINDGWIEPVLGNHIFVRGWDGRGKTIFAGMGNYAASVAELTLTNIKSISTSIGLYEGALGNVNFVIQVFDGLNYYTILDTIISDDGPSIFYDFDLSQWNDQEITLRFIADPYGSTFYDWSYWEEPKAVIGPFESDIKIEKIIYPNQQFKLEDKDKIKVKISNNGLQTIDTIILHYELANSDLEFNNLDTFVFSLNSYQDTVLCFEDSVDFSAFDQDFYVKVTVDSSNDNTYNLNDTLIRIYTLNHLVVSKVIDSIIIDGRPDDAWNNYIYEDISNILYKLPNNNSDFSAKFKSTWDTLGIYFLIKIIDNYLYSGHQDDWQNDCVELFFDINNSKSNVYEDKDFQIRLIWNINEVNSGDVNSLCDGGASSIEFAQIDTLEGYIFEVKFPWPVLCLDAPVNNQLVGFDIHVADNDGGDRDTKLLWNDNLDIAWKNTSVFGAIRFLDEQITCKSDTTNIIDTICNGENVQIGELIFTETGNYIVNLTNQYGCDSVVNLVLTVNPVDQTELTETICEGDNIQIGDSIFTETGNYSVTLSNQYGCDSVVNLALTVNPVNQIDLIEDICQGENIHIGDSIFTETGNYSVTLTNQYGCDSVVNLALTVNPVDQTELTETICEGDNIQIGDSIFTETGNYTVTLTNQYGCDSVVNLALTANPNPVVYLGDDDTITLIDKIIIDAGDGFATYKWSNGETTQTIIVDSLVGIGEHTYIVIVSDNNNCYGSDTIIITIEETTGIISFSETTGVIKLYPNPSNGKINIEIKNTQELTNVLIYSETGQIVFSKQYESISNSITEQLDLSNYLSGTYIIKVINNNMIKTEKFILKK